MDGTVKDKLIYLGAVPVLAAGVGAVATVLAQKYLGDATPPNDAVLAVLKMPGLTSEDRVKLIAAVSADSERFYGFLHLLLGFFAAPLGFILVRFGKA